MSKALDSPEKQISLTSNAPQDSPFANFANALSPIKPTKTVHANTFQDLCFNPPGHLSAVFSSPPHHRRKQLSSKRNNRQSNVLRGDTEPNPNPVSDASNQGTKRLPEPTPALDQTKSTNHSSLEKCSTNYDSNQDKKIRLQKQSVDNIEKETSHDCLSNMINSQHSNVDSSLDASIPDNKVQPPINPPTEPTPEPATLVSPMPAENTSTPASQTDQCKLECEKEGEGEGGVIFSQSSDSNIHHLQFSKGREETPSLPPSLLSCSQVCNIPHVPKALVCNEPNSVGEECDEKGKGAIVHDDGAFDSPSKYASLVAILQGGESNEDNKSYYSIPSSSPITPKSFTMPHPLSPVPSLRLDNEGSNPSNAKNSTESTEPLSLRPNLTQVIGSEESTPPPVLSQASNNEPWKENAGEGGRENVSQVSYGEDELDRDEMYAMMTTPVNISYEHMSLFTPEARRVRQDLSASVDSLMYSDVLNLPTNQVKSSVRQNRKTARAIAFVSHASGMKDPETVEKSEVTTQHVFVPMNRMTSDIAPLHSDGNSLASSAHEMEMKWSVNAVVDSSVRFGPNQDSFHSFDSLDSPSSFPSFSPMAASHSTSMNPSSFSNANFSPSPAAMVVFTSGGESVPPFHSTSAEEQHSVWKSGHVSSSRTKPTASEDMDMPNVKLNFSDFDSPAPIDIRTSSMMYKPKPSTEVMPFTILHHLPNTPSPFHATDLLAYGMQGNPLGSDRTYPQVGPNLSKRIQLEESEFHNAQSSPSNSLLLSEGSPQDSSGLSKKKRKAKDSGDGCKKCNCKKSRCLKLYCECFRSGVYCTGPCRCDDCQNLEEYADLVREIRTSISSRNPLAFAPKIISSKSPSPVPLNEIQDNTPSSARHKSGCNCKKSMCTKKYCECYQAGVGCMNGCRCENCMNPFGRALSRSGNEEGSDPSHDEQMHSADSSKGARPIPIPDPNPNSEVRYYENEGTVMAKEAMTPEPNMHSSRAINFPSPSSPSDLNIRTFNGRTSFHSATSSDNLIHSSASVFTESNFKPNQSFDVKFIRTLPPFPSSSNLTIQKLPQPNSQSQSQTWNNPRQQQGRILHIIGGEMNQSYSYLTPMIQSQNQNQTMKNSQSQSQNLQGVQDISSVSFSTNSLSSSPSPSPTFIGTNMAMEVKDDSLRYHHPHLSDPSPSPSLDLLSPHPFSPPLSSSVGSPVATIAFGRRMQRMDATHPSFSYPSPSLTVLSPLSSIHANMNFINQSPAQREKERQNNEKDSENDESVIQNFLIFPACEEGEGEGGGEREREQSFVGKKIENGGDELDNEDGDEEGALGEDEDVEIEGEGEEDDDESEKEETEGEEIERGRFAMNVPKTKSLSPNKKRISPPPYRNAKGEGEMMYDDFLLPSRKQFKKKKDAFSPRKKSHFNSSNDMVKVKPSPSPAHGYLS